MFAYDPGFGATAACESKITYIDDDQGMLPQHDYGAHPAKTQNGLLAFV